MENKKKVFIKLLLPAYFLLIFSVQTQAQSLKSFKGKASFYSHKFTGKKTANGEIFNNYDYTCAHKHLPFGTLIEVENPKTGRSVIVRVNDRGPYSAGRVLDLSYEAAKKLGLIQNGVSDIRATIIKRRKQANNPSPFNDSFSANYSRRFIYPVIGTNQEIKRYVYRL